MASKSKAPLKLPQTPYTSKVAFIAGSGVIGSAVAEQLLKDGYKVCVVSRSGTKKHEQCLAVKADLYDYAQFLAAVDVCQAKFGPISVGVCCAGELGAIQPVSAKHNRIGNPLCGIELNFARIISPILRQRQEGAMVFMTSALILNNIDSPHFTEVLAWANGVAGLTDGLTPEVRQASVRVTSLLLGFVSGSKFSRRMRDMFGGKAVNPILADESKWVSPSDIAKSVSFVTDPASVNGTVTELELNPQPMLDKNAAFTDVKRVEEMLSKLNNPPFRDNRVAMVTGSGKGIGRGVVLELCRAGFNIAAITRTAKDLDTLAQECKQINPKCEFLSLPLDVTDEKALEQAVQKTVEHFGTVTLVVSNAGTNRRRVAALADLKTWKDVMDVDLLAAMNLTRLTLPYLMRHARMSKLGDKPIVSYVSTRYAHHKGSRMPGIAPYITAKTATNAFAKIVSEEVRGFGVGVLGKS